MLRKIILILAILPFVISCKEEHNRLTDIEKINFDNFSPENFYKTYHILNSKKVNVDSLKAYNRDTLIQGSYEVNPFDTYPKVIQCYPNYTYYSQAQQTTDYLTEQDIKEERIFGVTPVSEIAVYKNIKFNYANFIVDKRNNKIVGCIFITRNHSETDYYKKSIDLLREKLGKPKYNNRGFTDDNGGPVHYPLVNDIWFINGKMFQFNMHLLEEGAKKYESITLLILNEDLIDTFDSSFNVNFTIFKNYFDKERSNKFQVESILTERVELKDLENANKKAQKVIDSIKAHK